MAATHIYFAGPIFDGPVRQAIMRRYIEATLEQLAVDGVHEVQMRLDDVLVNPTGFYRSNIQFSRVERSRIITDSNVIYGPWLEGIGSRNQTTRFKGYKTFRYVTQKLRKYAGPFANAMLERGGFLRELNGTGTAVGVRKFM